MKPAALSDIRLSVVVAVYSETFSIDETVETLLRRDRGYIQEIILVVSAKASEETLDICRKWAARESRVRLQIQINNPGLGWAYREGMRSASGNYIALMASDLETEPAAVDRMVDKIAATGCDEVVANRWMRGGGFVGYAPAKLALNWIFQTVFRALFRTPIGDLTFGFKILTKELAETIAWESTLHEICLETTVKPIRLGAHIEQISAVWTGRREGVSVNAFFRNFRYVRTALKALLGSRAGMTVSARGAAVGALAILLFSGYSPAVGASPPIKTKDFEIWSSTEMLWRGEGEVFKEGALKKSLAAKPDDFDNEYELVKIYDETGRYAEELPILKKMIGKEPGEYYLYAKLAHAYLRLGRAAEAKESFAQAKRIDGRAGGAYIVEGYFYMGSDPVRAEEDFENAIAVDTSSPYGYHHMGAYLSVSQRYPEAERYLRRALEILEADPNAPSDDLLHTRYWLGCVLQAQGRYSEAEAVYVKALERARPGDGGPHQATLLRSLADLEVVEGKVARAEVLYRRVMAPCAARSGCRIIYPDTVAASLHLAQLFLRQGRRDEAEEMANRIEAACENPATSRELFRELSGFPAFYANLDDVAKREAFFARLMRVRRTMPLDPGLVWVESGLAELDAEEGRFREAEELYRRAIRVVDRDDAPRWDEKARLLDALAGLYASQGRSARAEETYNRAAAACRGRFKCNFERAARTRIDLGEFYLGQGRRAEAEAEAAGAEKLCAGVAASQELFETLRNLSLLDKNLGDVSRREAIYARLLPLRRTMPLNPDLVWLEEGAADLDAEKGRFGEAEELDRRAIEILDRNGSRSAEAGMLERLAGLYAFQGRSARAEEAYKRAAAACRARSECDAGRAGGVLIDLGEFYLGQGRRTEAEAMAERAEKFFADIPIGPRIFDALRNLSFLYKNLGDIPKETALDDRLLPMRRRLPLDPDLAWVERGLADADMSHGRFSEAEDHYLRAIGLLDRGGRRSEEAESLDRLAEACGKDGKPREAARAAERAKTLRAAADGGRYANMNGRRAVGRKRI